LKIEFDLCREASAVNDAGQQVPQCTSAAIQIRYESLYRRFSPRRRRSLGGRVGVRARIELTQHSQRECGAFRADAYTCFASETRSISETRVCRKRRSFDLKGLVMSPKLLTQMGFLCFICGFISIFLSLIIFFVIDNTDPAYTQRLGIFVGLWAPTFFALSSRFDRYSITPARF
jgi:hypothetical protein